MNIRNLGRKLYDLVSPNTPLLVFVAGLLLLAFLASSWFVVDGAEKFITDIADPTERGLAYIAGAVVLHAFLGKSEINVTQEKESK